MNDHPGSARPIEALLFDFGNVLVNIDFQRSFAAWAEMAGVAPQLVTERFSHDAAYCAHERGEIDGEQYFAALREQLQIDLSDADFLDGWNALFLEPLCGMTELLPLLARRWPLYLFSNTNRLHYEYWGARYRPLLTHFSGVFCSHTLGERKPERAAFDRVAQAIGVPAAHIAFFDDLEENVQGARRAGLQAWQVRAADEVCRALAFKE